MRVQTLSDKAFLSRIAESCVAGPSKIVRQAAQAHGFLNSQLSALARAVEFLIAIVIAKTPIAQLSCGSEAS